MIKRLFTHVLSLALLVLTPVLQAEEVSSTASVSIMLPDGSPVSKPVVPKQTLSLHVDTMTTSWFAAPPVYPQWPD